MPKDVVAAADPLDVPALLFENGDDLLAADRRIGSPSRASPLGGFLDRLALGGNTGQLGHEDAEAAFGLRLQDDLALATVEAYAPLALLSPTRFKPE